MESQKLITLAQIQRHHGIPRDGVCHFKAKMPVTGGVSLQKAKTVWISKISSFDKNFKEANTDLSNFVKLDLAAPTKPSGGKWGECSEVLIALKQEDLKQWNGVIKGHRIALERSSFPSIGGAEFYLCDLINMLVKNGEGLTIGTVTAFASLSQDSFNLEVTDSNGNSFDFPTKWIDWDQSKVGTSNNDDHFLVVPGIEEWSQL